MYQKKPPEPGVQTVVNSNKIKFEPYGDLADEAYSCYNGNMLDNPDYFGQIENNEIGEAMYFSDQGEENTKSNRNSVIPNFMSGIMVDDKIKKKH